MDELWQEAYEIALETGKDANEVYQEMLDEEEYKREQAYDAWREEQL